MKILLTLAAFAALTGPTVAQTTMGGSMMRSTMLMPRCAANNPVVWLNMRTKTYYVRGTSYAGKNEHGRYVCLSAAQAMGAHQSGMSRAVMPSKPMHGATTMPHAMMPHTMASPASMIAPDMMEKGGAAAGSAPSSPMPVPSSSGAPASPEPSSSP